MQERGHLQLGELLEQWEIIRMIERAAVDVGEKQRAAVSQLRDRALQFEYGGLGIVQRQRGQRRETAGIAGGRLRELIVDQTCQLDAAPRVFHVYAGRRKADRL